ncbi:GRIN2-like protein isoform X1 [Carcharodon carcharias]|uniref:GRIN2-like protein isoform X1 n=2 Tax=Carcharodon carcharias TaxID=13397 RepID=UPI001B7EBDA2|nr:GRIN2-like protein isoform X1 [Carcharodon carcharias]
MNHFGVKIADCSKLLSHRRGALECHFRMATYSRRLSDYSFQETQNTVCHNTLEPDCFPLSKSSSATLFPRRDSMEERQTTKQELRKTLSSVVSPRNSVEMDMRCPYHPLCFTPQDNFTVIPLCHCFHMGTIPDPNHVSEFPIFQDDSKIHTNSHMNTNSSMGKDTDTMLCADSNLGKLQAKMMHRSCSDIIHGYKENCYRGSVVHSKTTTAHQAAVPGRGYSIIPQDEIVTKECSQKIVINISGSETDTGYQENVSESAAIAEHQDNCIANDLCSPMHRGHLMFTESSLNYPSVTVVQESGRQYQGNSVTRNEMIATDQGSVTYREGVATHQNSLMGNHTCTGLQSHLISGLRIQDTTPAYCHSLPIPAIHLFPRLVSSVSESGRGTVVNACCHPLPVSGILTFPRLVSSVSESGLDARHLLKCHGNMENEAVHTAVDRNSQNTSDGEKAEQKFSHSLLQNNSNSNVGVRTRDTWTMTSVTDLTLRYRHQLEHKDAEVQTSLAVNCRSVGTSPMSPTDSCLVHMFPEVNLEENQLIQESPVREVKWDDKGMTWEVYGASVDPEVLGLAIQKHLEIQIEQHEKDKMSIAEKTVKQLSTHADGTCVMEQPVKEKRHLPGFRNMMSTLRHPTCCVRSSAAID